MFVLVLITSSQVGWIEAEFEILSLPLEVEASWTTVMKYWEE